MTFPVILQFNTKKDVVTESMVDVSVIIPVKNGETYIDACLESIFNCNYPRDKYEVIVVDNGSTDSTVNIAKSRGVSVYKKPGVSISALRNYGAEMAQGTILAFTDVDCIVDESWMGAASGYFKDEKVACFGSTPGIPANASWVQKTWYLNKEIRKDIQRVDWLESMNLFVKKDVFSKVGGFNERLETCEDVDLCYRIGEKYHIVSDKRIKAIHLGEARTLNEFFKKEMWRGKGNLKGLKEHGIKLKEIPSIVLPLYYLILPIIFFALLYINDILFATAFSVILLVSPPLLISIYVTNRISRFNYLFKASIVYLVYFIARAVSIVR